MANLWFVSDTHFQHANILKFEPSRPGNTIEEHDAILIDNWNSVVKPGDKVYHLGDVFFGNKETFKVLWPKLNGRKRLIVGNHDDIKFISSGAFFEKVLFWRQFREYGLILTHAPLHPTTLGEDRWKGANFINLHGHTHGSGSPEGPYRSVCVELINYIPINIDEVRK